jgi:hypothetical protein
MIKQIIYNNCPNLGICYIVSALLENTLLTVAEATETCRYMNIKGKGHPPTGRGGPRGSGWLRFRIFLTFGTTRVVGHQPYEPAAFTPEESPGTHFRRLSRPQGTWFCRKEPRKKSPVAPPRIDPGTVRLVAQCLKHYAISGRGEYYCTIKYI